MDDIGLRLKTLRETRKLTQGEVAEKLNLKIATISGYERNATVPSLDVLKNLAILYNVSADYILGLDDRETICLDGFSEENKQALIRIVNEIKQIAK